MYTYINIDIQHGRYFPRTCTKIWKKSKCEKR